MQLIATELAEVVCGQGFRFNKLFRKRNRVGSGHGHGQVRGWAMDGYS